MDGLTANLFIIPIGVGATTVICWSSYDLEGKFSLFTDNGTYGKEIALLLLLSLIYFVTDLYLMIKYYKPEEKIYFIHHFIGLMSVLMVYFGYYFLVKYLLGYLMYELSTPFLNISLMYRKKGIENQIKRYFDLIFFAVYTAIRILFGTYLLISILPILLAGGGSIMKYMSILPVVLQAMNYWWYYKIVKFMLKKKKKSE